jgi:hypothetical protein
VRHFGARTSNERAGVFDLIAALVGRLATAIATTGSVPCTDERRYLR